MKSQGWRGRVAMVWSGEAANGRIRWGRIRGWASGRRGGSAETWTGSTAIRGNRRLHVRPGERRTVPGECEKGGPPDMRTEGPSHILLGSRVSWSGRRTWSTIRCTCRPGNRCLKDVSRKFGDLEEVLAEVRKLLGGLRYGAVTVTVHNGRVVHIERIEKVRIAGSFRATSPHEGQDSA